jgi:cyclophilin family peptidyl-prolyl cis-trans isomerase
MRIAFQGAWRPSALAICLLAAWSCAGTGDGNLTNEVPVREAVKTTPGEKPYLYGMAAVDALYNGYGEGAPQGRGPSQGRIGAEGNAYLNKQFPRLDYIRKATIIPAAARKETATTSTGNEPFRVKFEVSTGEFVVEVNPEWAPNGARRFRELVEAGYYDDCRFFRVVEGFMAQVGMNGDPAVNAQWDSKTIPDDPVLRWSNTRGRVTFATSGANSRTTQFFISFGDNSRLDAQGFSPIGEVIETEPEATAPLSAPPEAGGEPAPQ